MPRHDGRRPDEIRPVQITRGYTSAAPGSVLIRAGRTTVLCTASWVSEVPRWMSGKGTGWLTAEYDMLPAAGGQRKPRNRQSLDGRTQEIQRLIGRSLRAVTNLQLLGENTIYIDCDVIEADGGTRTASITGAYVALVDCIRDAQSKRTLARSPIMDEVAAISVGKVGGRLLLDLDYREDSTADVDMNVVVTGAGRLIEVQSTAERATFTYSELQRMLKLGLSGTNRLITQQRAALRRRAARRG